MGAADVIRIKKVKCGWILYDDTGNGRHSHFRNKKSAKECLTLIKKRQLPEKPYYVESCRRLLSNKEFERLRARKEKQRYYNQSYAR